MAAGRHALDTSMKTIVDGLVIEYADEGEGDVLLFLHGWGDSHRTWDDLAAQLSASYRIVRPDLPGFGASTRPRDAWSVGDYAVFVSSLCTKLGIAPRVIVGHSFGGRIAIKGAAEHILSPEKIVLIASAGNAHRRTLRNALFLVVAKIGKCVSLLLPRVQREALRRRLYASAKSDYAGTGAMRDIFLRTIREDLSEAARRIESPVLLVWGEADRITPLSDGRRLAACIAHATFLSYPGAGHFVHREGALDIARDITAFI